MYGKSKKKSLNYFKIKKIMVGKSPKIIKIAKIKIIKDLRKITVSSVLG